MRGQTFLYSVQLDSRVSEGLDRRDYQDLSVDLVSGGTWETLATYPQGDSYAGFTSVSVVASQNGFTVNYSTENSPLVPSTERESASLASRSAVQVWVPENAPVTSVDITRTVDNMGINCVAPIFAGCDSGTFEQSFTTRTESSFDSPTATVGGITYRRLGAFGAEIDDIPALRDFAFTLVGAGNLGSGNATFSYDLTNLSRPRSGIQLDSVNDSDPENPIISFQLFEPLSDVRWSIGSRTVNLGNLGPGNHTFTIEEIRDLGDGVWGLRVFGENNSSETLRSNLATYDLQSLGTQVIDSTKPVVVFGVPGWRSGTYRLAAEVTSADWSLPGASYDIYIGEVVATLTSTVDLPDDSWSSVRLRADGFSREFNEGLSLEDNSIGSGQFYSESFSTFLDAYSSTEDLSAGLNASFYAWSNPGNGVTYWNMPGSSVYLPISSLASSSVASGTASVPEPSSSVLFFLLIACLPVLITER